MSVRLPVMFVPHGAGPWPFLDLSSGIFGEPKNWHALEQQLRDAGKQLRPRPAGIVVITAHWEAPEITVSSNPQPGMLFDYGGFPQNTYQLDYPAPGSADLAQKIRNRLTDASIPSAADSKRGFDHGTFIPLMLMFPDADIPVVQVSVAYSHDPALHIRVGEALAPLRELGILIVASGMSVHNMPGFRAPSVTHQANASAFDHWLFETLQRPAAERKQQLTQWRNAPGGVASHQPSPEHLTPLFVAAGAAGDDRVTRTFSEALMGLQVSGYQFG